MTVVAWLMAEVWGIEMPASVAAALTTVVVFVTSYFVSEPPRALDRDH